MTKHTDINMLIFAKYDKECDTKVPTERKEWFKVWEVQQSQQWERREELQEVL